MTAAALRTLYPLVKQIVPNRFMRLLCLFYLLAFFQPNLAIAKNNSTPALAQKAKAKPQPQQPAPPQEAAKTVEKSAPSPEPAAPTPQPQTPQEQMHASDIGIQIFGVIINGKDPNANVVLVKFTKSNQTDAKKIGHKLELAKTYTIAGIGQNYIDLLEDLKKEPIRVYKDGFSIPSSATPPPPPVAAPKTAAAYSENYREEGFERTKGDITMSQEYRKKIIETDLASILMQASAEAALDSNGNIIGFTMDQIDENSIFWKGGLTNGDIIKSINGEELNNIQTTIKLLHSLKKADQIDLEIIRGGAVTPLTIKVKG